MNRMDCFRKQPPLFHYGCGRMPVSRMFGGYHESVFCVLPRRWSTAGEVWKKLAERGLPSEATVRSHLRRLAHEGRILERTRNRVQEWRRK